MTTRRSAPARASGSRVLASAPGLCSVSRRQSVIVLTLMAMVIPLRRRKCRVIDRPRGAGEPRFGTGLLDRRMDQDEFRKEEPSAPRGLSCRRSVNSAVAAPRALPPALRPPGLSPQRVDLDPAGRAIDMEWLVSGTAQPEPFELLAAEEEGGGGLVVGGIPWGHPPHS